MNSFDKKDLILIVDDDSDFLSTISIMMEEGYRVDTARMGVEALEKSRSEYYALMLIDIKLPDIEGIALLTQIKETDPEIHKVIITGYPTLENAKRALNLGAHTYLIKPFDTGTLLETIRRQLEERDREFRERYPSIAYAIS